MVPRSADAREVRRVVQRREGECTPRMPFFTDVVDARGVDDQRLAAVHHPVPDRVDGMPSRRSGSATARAAAWSASGMGDDRIAHGRGCTRRGPRARRGRWRRARQVRGSRRSSFTLELPQLTTRTFMVWRACPDGGIAPSRAATSGLCPGAASGRGRRPRRTEDTDTMATKTAWGGRFTQELDAGAARFLASVDVDSRLAEVDIAGSLAHAEMLCSIGVLTADEGDAGAAGPRGDSRGDPRRDLRVGRRQGGRAHERRGRAHRARGRRRRAAAHRPQPQRPGRDGPAPLRARGAATDVGRSLDRLALALVRRAERGATR